MRDEYDLDREAAAVEAARLDGFETCERLVAEMLEAMSRAEDAVSLKAAGLSVTLPHLDDRVREGRSAKVRAARAGALREAALVVRQGRARQAGKEEA